MLHKVVQILGNVGRPRRSQQAAMSERSWTKLGGAMEPSHDFSSAQQSHRGIELPLARVLQVVASLGVIKNFLDLGARIVRSPVDGLNFWIARLVHLLVP